MKKNSAFAKAKSAALKKDPTLKALFARHQLDFSPKMQRSPFESLVRAIAHQQLHGKAAETILGRMLALFPEANFPSPEDLLNLQERQLRACGFSQSKTKSLFDIAQKTVDGIVPSAKQIRRMPNEEIIARLTEIHGVGQWTVEMLLIFQLGRMDVWPVDDFGIRKGFQVWKRKRDFPTAKQLRPHGEKWSPYQTVVALHLWREADLHKSKK
jgi:DNA-3-methyladenine glycosylase II